MSIVKMVELELNIELNEDISAASMTANINPLAPIGINSFTSLMNARFVHPPLQRYQEKNQLLVKSQHIMSNNNTNMLDNNRKLTQIDIFPYTLPERHIQLHS